MKLHLLVLLLLLGLAFTGCGKKAEPAAATESAVAAQTDSTAEVSAPSVNANKAPWKSLARADNDDEKALYIKASELISQANAMDQATPDPSSVSLDNWYIIRFGVANGDVRTPVYIVDMNNEKVITRDEISLIQPLCMDLINRLPDNYNERLNELNHIASITTAVLFGHERHVMLDVGSAEEPRIELQDNDYKLTYDILPAQGETTGKHIALIISSDGISVEEIEKSFED